MQSPGGGLPSAHRRSFLSRALVGCVLGLVAVSGCVALLVYNPWDPTRPPRCLFELDETSIFGRALAVIGDVDGDGLDDLATVTADSGQIGSVHSGIDGRVLFRLTARGAGRFASRSVTGPGDLDGDGVPDVLVSEGKFDEERGVVWGYSGADGRLLYTVHGDEPGWSLGDCLASTGDLDADGRGDWIASVREPERRLRLTSGATGEVIQWLRPPTPETRYGSRVRSVGDLDGDGRFEIAVLSKRSDEVPLVHMYRGGDRTLLWTLGPDLGWHGLSSLPANAGDRDGDGTPDLWVATDRGIHVASGRDGQRVEDILEVSGPTIAPIGDYDGDGIVDLLFSWFSSESHDMLLEVNVYSRACLRSGDTGDTLFQLAFEHPFPSLVPCGDLDGDGGDEFAAPVSSRMHVFSWPESR